MEFAFISVALSPSWLRCSDHAHQSGACVAVFNHFAVGYFRGVLCAGRAFCRCAGNYRLRGCHYGAVRVRGDDAQLGGSEIEQERQWLKPQVWIGPAILSAIMLVVIVYAILGVNDRGIDGTPISAKAVGIALFGPYVLAVELASMLLLAGWLLPSTSVAKNVWVRC